MIHNEFSVVDSNCSATDKVLMDATIFSPLWRNLLPSSILLLFQMMYKSSVISSVSSFVLMYSPFSTECVE